MCSSKCVRRVVGIRVNITCDTLIRCGLFETKTRLDLCDYLLICSLLVTKLILLCDAYLSAETSKVFLLKKKKLGIVYY